MPAAPSGAPRHRLRPSLARPRLTLGIVGGPGARCGGRRGSRSRHPRAPLTPYPLPTPARARSADVFYTSTAVAQRAPFSRLHPLRFVAGEAPGRSRGGWSLASSRGRTKGGPSAQTRSPPPPRREPHPYRGVGVPDRPVEQINALRQLRALLPRGPTIPASFCHISQCALVCVCASRRLRVWDARARPVPLHQT